MFVVGGISISVRGLIRRRLFLGATFFYSHYTPRREANNEHLCSYCDNKLANIASDETADMRCWPNNPLGSARLGSARLGLRARSPSAQGHVTEREDQRLGTGLCTVGGT